MTLPQEMTDFLIVMGGGFFISIFAVVIGGGMFFAVPLMQWIFPGAAFGAVVGNIKVGGFFRSIGSTITTHRKIHYLRNIRLSAVLFAGTALGSTLIAHLDQKWMFPAIVLAVLLAFYAPKIAHKISPRTFALASFLIGLYAGVIGAGIGILLIALLRLKYTADEEIATVKIQARFVEFLLVIVAVTTHTLHGNIVADMWIPWSLGSLAGGFAGGALLKKIDKMPGHLQRYVLYAAFAVALIVSGLDFLGYTL